MTVAFLVAVGAAEGGRADPDVPDQGGGTPGHREHGRGVACAGCPPLKELLRRYADAGGTYLVCPICFESRDCRPTLVAERRVGRHRRNVGVDRR